MYTRKEIEEKIRTNNLWLIRAILAIYDRQTTTEKIEKVSKFENGIGFNKTDSHFFSSISRILISIYKTKKPTMYFDGCLSSKQLYVCRKRILKYSGQLEKIANS